MLRSLLFVIVSLPLFSFANETEDVIYKKDGSILRGTLIEQNFEQAFYKIQIKGGSVFVIQQDDVSKIAKEPITEQAPQVAPSTPMVSAPVVDSINKADDKTDGVFFIGSITRNLTTDTSHYYQTEYLYNGWNIGGLKNFNQHLALYADMNVAELSEGTRTYSWGYEEPLTDSELTNTDYISMQISLLLSTNQYKGWQFFTGIGRFKERFSTDERDKSYEGEVYQLGLGYSWQSLQLLLRLNILDGDYPDHFTNNTNGHLQLGFNFQ